MPARPLRRVVAVLVCSVCLPIWQAVAWVPAVGAASASASGGPLARAGDAGTGPPSWTGDVALADSGIVWSDVPANHWARRAIDYVAATNAWMRDRRPAEDGTYLFQPDRLERRRLFARAIVQAFGDGLEPDPAMTFPDLASSDRFYPFANVAVTAGWMEVAQDGSFRPAEPVTTREVHQALVLALGMGDLAAGAQALHLRDGTPVPVPKDFGTLLLGMRLGLRYNHGDESIDVGPDSPLPRAEVAWSLFRAATAPSWIRDSLARYATITLPNLSPKLQQVVAFGVRYVGYPYVWGGEWHEASPSPYCCGYQPIGGFDCSGITWWSMRKASDGWNPIPPRVYAGWTLPQRTSASMAANGQTVGWQELKPGDLMFYDGNADGSVDHVDTFLGGGWALDSGSSNAGVTITYVGAGSWYEDHFVHGRRIID